MQQINHTQNIIEFQDVSFSYGEEVVIKDVSMAIHKGDYLGIIGPNGGGKSTLMKLMLGLLTPTKGKIFYLELKLKSLRIGQNSVTFLKK